MCQECKGLHLKTRFSREHDVYKLERSQDRVDSECSQHPGKMIEYCCKQCHQRVCAVCAIVDHRSHEIESLSDAANGERQRLATAISYLRGLFDRKMEEATRDIKDFKRDVENLKIELNELADKLVALINQQRQLGLKEIDTKAAKTLQRLGAERAKVAARASRSRSCARVAHRLLQEGTDAEVYELTAVSKLLRTDFRRIYRLLLVAHLLVDPSPCFPLLLLAFVSSSQSNSRLPLLVFLSYAYFFCLVQLYFDIFLPFFVV